MQLVDKIPINALQRYMGHKSLNSTGEYIKLSDEQAAEAVRKARESD